MVMLGTDQPTLVDLAAVRARAAGPDMGAVGQSLLGVGFRSPFELLSSYLGRAEDLAPWTAGAHINHDRRPWLQYRAGWDSYTPQPTDLMRAIARYRRVPGGEVARRGAPAARVVPAGGGPARAPAPARRAPPL